MAFTHGYGKIAFIRYSLLLKEVKEVFINIDEEGVMSVDIQRKKIIFVGGKGGVGKSTTSTALALKLAQAGKKTLLISTDPAHNIGHIFNMKIGGKQTEIRTNLFGIEIDPAYETEEYIQSVKNNIKGVVQSTMMEEVHRQLDTAKASPGAEEAALFDKLISIIIEKSEQFDHIVFDTAPTGHTIRLLSLPELMGVWIEGLLEKRQKTKTNYSRLLNDGEPIEDPIFDVLKERQRRFKKVREKMLDNSQTEFIFVLNPEQLPIVETKNALELLAHYDLYVRTLIINRVLPDKDEGKFFRQRKELEKEYVQQIHDSFTEQQLLFVPFFAHDITEQSQLEQFASYISIS